MIQKLKSSIPELSLIAATLYYWSLTALVVNWFAISLLALLLFLVVRQHKTVGIIFSVLIIAINLYLVLALISEFNEFPEFNKPAKILLFVGGLFILFNLSCASLMLLKYMKKPLTNNDTISDSSHA